MKTSRGGDEQKAFLFLRFKDFSRYYYTYSREFNCDYSFDLTYTFENFT